MSDAYCPECGDPMMTSYSSSDHFHQSVCGHESFSTNSSGGMRRLMRGRWKFWATRKDLLPLVDNPEVLDAKEGRTHRERFVLAATRHSVENLKDFLKKELCLIKMVFGKDHPDLREVIAEEIATITPVPKDVLIMCQEKLQKEALQEQEPTKPSEAELS